MYITTRLNNLFFLLKKRRYRSIYRKLKFRVYSDTYSYGLKRDLSMPFAPKKPKVQTKDGAEGEGDELEAEEHEARRRRGGGRVQPVPRSGLR